MPTGVCVRYMHVAALLAAAACGPISGGGDGGDATTDGPVDAPTDAPLDAPVTDAPNDGPDASVDAGKDATLDGGLDATLDSAMDAGTDVGSDAAVDAPADISVDATPDASSAVCGDGLRDLTEECDDGVVSLLLDSCSSLCEVRDLVAVASPTDASLPSRTLGLGRHPIAASANGFAVAWVEPATPTVGMTFYGPKGVPTGKIDRFGVGTTNLTTSAPVLAALPSGKYVVAWTDLGGDGDAEGIALRLVDPGVASSGAPAHANTTTAFSQYDADVLWTGTELIVAWADTSNGQTGPDLRYRTFDATLTPTSSEQTLAGSSAVEEGVALTAFAGSWAAAWREAQNGFETLRVHAGNVAFTVTSFELDFWGRVRSLDKAALANYLATDEARESIATWQRSAIVATCRAPKVLRPAAPLARHRPRFSPTGQAQRNRRFGGRAGAFGCRGHLRRRSGNPEGSRASLPNIQNGAIAASVPLNC